jgi:hypothetical protein
MRRILVQISMLGALGAVLLPTDWPVFRGRFGMAFAR